MNNVIFRFFFIYFFLFVLPVDIDWLLKRLVNDFSVNNNGSGDQLANYIATAVLIGVSAAGTLVWSIIDRKRENYKRLGWVLRVCCRYFLAYVMMGYGLSKVLPLQFQFPNLRDLVVPFGELSPMGLLWKMMGYSAGYSFFCGLGEVVGSVLLLFRRTTTLGALILLAILSNVVMLNFCYDIPVKLLSCHLLLMAVALLIPDFKRLADLFIFNRPVQAADLKVERFGRSRIVCKALSLIFIVGGSFWDAWNLNQLISPPSSPLYGIYEIREYKKNGEILPPLLTDERYLRYIIFDKQGVTFRTMNDKSRHFGFALDDKTITFTRMDGQTFKLYCQEMEGDSLVLAGEYEGSEVVVAMRKKSVDDFLLINRGFHWVNESPFL